MLSRHESNCGHCKWVELQPRTKYYRSMLLPNALHDGLMTAVGGAVFIIAANLSSPIPDPLFTREQVDGFVMFMAHVG